LDKELDDASLAGLREGDEGDDDRGSCDCEIILLHGHFLQIILSEVTATFARWKAIHGR
jgi:hypothetical protein